MLTLPNFERLKVFHTLYCHGSIQRAADAMGITRSAVSQSLKNLEHELGTKLVIRTSKKFLCTEEGEHLFKTVDPFISDLRTALESLDAGKNNLSGLLRVGAPLEFGSEQLTKIIGEFRRKFPDIIFELILAIPIRQLELLCAGKIDIAFIDNGDIHAQNFPVVIQKFIQEEFVMVAHPNLLKATKIEKVDFQTLSKMPIVDYLPHAPVARMWFRHHFSREPKHLPVAFSAESVRAVLNAISCGIGIGIVPDRLLVGTFAQLTIIETARGRFTNQILIARQEGRRIKSREREFIAFCQDWVKKS